MTKTEVTNHRDLLHSKVEEHKDNITQLEAKIVKNKNKAEEEKRIIHEEK
jgi:hypothetical protein